MAEDSGNEDNWLYGDSNAEPTEENAPGIEDTQESQGQEEEEPPPENTVSTYF